MPLKCVCAWAGEYVFYKQRTFANPQYTIQAITVTDVQAQMLRQFCLKASKMKIPFDRVGMYAVHLPHRLCSAIKTMQKAFSLRDGDRKNLGYNRRNRYRQLETCASISSTANFCIEEDNEKDNEKDNGEDDENGDENAVLRELVKEGVFCSKFIVKAMQYAGVYGFHEMDANKASPSSLYHRILQQDFQNTFGGLVTATSPFRQQLLAEKGRIRI